LTRSESFRFDMYLAASFLSYGISAVVNAVISLFLDLETVHVLIGIIMASFPPFLGGFGAGYITKNRVDDEYWKIGLATGLGAFLVNFAMSVAIYGHFDGVFWVLMSYIFGGCTGGWVGGQPWMRLKGGFFSKNK